MSTSYFIDTPTGQIHIQRAGKGPVVIAVHGVLSSARTFEPLMATAARNQQFEVVAIDLPGHGKSPLPRRFKPGWHAFTRVVMEAADQLNLDQFALMGHSMGAGVAALAAAKNPGRVDRLILVDGVTAPFRLPPKGQILRIPLLGDILFGLIYRKAMFQDYFRNDVFHRADRIDKDRLDAYYQVFSKHRRNTLHTIRATGDATDILCALPDISCSTLIIFGEHDKLVPLRLGKQAADIINSARLTTIADCGHAPIEECPNETIPLICGFLT